MRAKMAIPNKKLSCTKENASKCPKFNNPNVCVYAYTERTEAGKIIKSVKHEDLDPILDVCKISPPYTALEGSVGQGTEANPKAHPKEERARIKTADLLTILKRMTKAIKKLNIKELRIDPKASPVAKEEMERFLLRCIENNTTRETHAMVLLFISGIMSYYKARETKQV